MKAPEYASHGYVVCDLREPSQVSLHNIIQKSMMADVSQKRRSSIRSLRHNLSQVRWIEIAAFGLNRIDVIQRNGGRKVPPQAPETLGVEFSGTVWRSGTSKVWVVGDEVFDLAYGVAYAEYIAVGERMLIRKPIELSG